MTIEQIERYMQIVDDLDKHIYYDKSYGVWYWNNGYGNEEETDVGPFDTFLDAVADIVEPYVKSE